ncbi:efflux RND transporter periplasmic adaptor subunit [Tuberibacillus sp. Marseille-P3662]|uniref:efflux RND transporter periplasmic adaptor subunit n=1 Tax=Tuberibacillus sp. Marseille-P3662 TaxID=1965358 RepID=UPI000A1CA5B1|nr:efflux RND transporter periplasmic adaptor subunit [Tuberibacillus sp. Marseille-P3662]
MKKWSVIGVILALVIGTGAWFFLKDEPQKTMAKTPTVSVQKGKLEVNISGSGSISSAASQDVSTDENKEVYDVDVSKNDQVDQGDTLLTFSDGTELEAPIGGTLTKFSLEEGDRVTAGKAIAHITNYNDLQTTIQVDEMNISKVKTGQNATIKVSAFPDQSFTGKVTRVAKEGNVSNGVSTFDVTIHIKKAGDLKVGMTTEASITTKSKKNALYVPVSAIHEQSDKKYVLLVTKKGQNNQANQTKQQTVTTGIANDEYVEITKGLEQEDLIQLPPVANDSQDSNARQQMQGRMGGVGNNRGGFEGMRPGGSGGGPSGGASRGR